MEKFDTIEDYKDHLIKEKVNCYTCQYRESVAGSCHSSCSFEFPKKIQSLNLLSMAQGLTTTNPSHLTVSDIPLMEWDKVGLSKGYVIFPFNFDPVWLNYCLIHKKL
jgi:hypothetical protein